MTPFETQFSELKTIHEGATSTAFASGAFLIEIPNYVLPKGWNRDKATILFIAPPGYPAAQPDCFWVEPVLRLENGGTPNNTNDGTLIPELNIVRGTWFSWHVQHWNPNTDSLRSYLQVINQRLLTLK